MSKIFSFIFLILIFSMITGCTKSEADLIVQNGTVYTVDSLFTTVGSFAVKNGKIIATGTTEQIQSKYHAKEILDISGKFVYPGFNDAHAHFYGYGMNLLQRANLAGIKSTEEIYAILQAHHSKFGGDWLLGRGWDQNNWNDKQFPDKSRLDELFPNVAVYLIRVDGHAGWCNTKALQLAGITAGTKIPGGEVMVKNGVPTGILIDNAESLVGNVVPKPDMEMKAKALLAAQNNCFAAGLTSVTDCGLPKDIVLLMDSLHKAGGLKIRINAMLDPSEENFLHFVENGTYLTDRLVVRTIKMYADGALGSRGALMISPFADDPNNRGLQIADQQFYDDVCAKALKYGYQVATHCIGDSANRLMLNTYGKYLSGSNDLRWRIEHVQVVHPADFELFAKYSIVPSIQATHATSDMDWATQRLGELRIKNAYAYQKLLRQLGWLPNGTDFPVEDISPVNTFFSSVFRTHHNGNPQGGFQPENALTREQALRSMTIWAAKASFEENQKGSLETGKSADFVVLDTDLLTADPAGVIKAKVESTWLAGEKVY